MKHITGLSSREPPRDREVEIHPGRGGAGVLQTPRAARSLGGTNLVPR